MSIETDNSLIESLRKDMAGRSLIRARRLASVPPHRRGWLMRRLLAIADIVGLAVAFAIAESSYGSRGYPDAVKLRDEVILFVAVLPIWLLGAKLFGLYDKDEERTDNSTVHDTLRVFLLASVGAFVADRLVTIQDLANPNMGKLTLFWALTIVFVTTTRTIARTIGRRLPNYVQKTVVVGAGEVGQLFARKVHTHPEYGIDLLGFVDDGNGIERSDLGDFRIIGRLNDLSEIVRQQHVERVIFAFPEGEDAKHVALIRSLRGAGVRVDIVPRLFEAVGPRYEMHMVEGVPLLGLAPLKIPPPLVARAAKRSLDILASSIGLVLTLPVMVTISLLIKKSSPGPVFFRQERLGKDMRSFTLLKFRTMATNADEEVHRDYIASTMSASAPLGQNGVYKLDREKEITRIGGWLRRTSLDELPQLWNVFRGDMSLVGPRPCLPYEIEFFAPHHFDRFLVPAGLTGLWQVSARAHSTFGEALDLDALYAQNWSFGLDLTLLARTPAQLLRTGGTR